MGRREKTYFDESLNQNMGNYWQYIERLTDLSISVFEWSNLPDTIDARFLELTLFSDGQAVYFRDEVLGDLCLQCATMAPLNVYRIPTRRRAYASNGYNKDLTIDDSVIIYNNLLHINSYPMIRYYAMRLWDLDRIIDVNAKAQKTPVLIQATEQQRLTLLNIYKQYEGNAPVIFGDKNLDLNALRSLNTGAPYVADKVYDLKNQIWNEALTYIGISNVAYQKKERLISDEVTRGQGGTLSSRYSRLEARKTAAEQINKMFGTNIEVDFRDASIDAELIQQMQDLQNENALEEVTGNE